MPKTQTDAEPPEHSALHVNSVQNGDCLLDASENTRSKYELYIKSDFKKLFGSLRAPPKK